MVGNLFLGNEVTHAGVLDEIAMEKRASELLDTPSVRIPSVRIPVAALSGGQRQSVAIARSLLGEPKVVLLDEPTAALGVAQTAQVLDLIERLRDRGHGVVLISHNLADVKAVADRVTVLRLGRIAGTFSMQDTSQEQIVQAITGASDNVVARRQARTSAAADGTQNVTAEDAEGLGRVRHPGAAMTTVTNSRPDDAAGSGRRRRPPPSDAIRRRSGAAALR